MIPSSRIFSVVLLVLLFGTSAIGQDSTGQSNDKERITAERYLSVLLRRPRPGVALDRVYGYHVQNDSLPELEKQLTAEGDQAGSRQMVWGLIQLQRGKSSEAVRLLKDAETQLPDEAACPYYLGRAYLGVGQTEQAAAAMERAIELGPARTEALPIFTELGRIYSRAGQSEKSLGVWTRLEKLFPGDSRVGGQIAQALAEEGNYEQAKLRYEALAKSTRKPDEKIAFSVQAAEMQRRLGASDEATAALEKILARLRPGSWLHTDVRNRIEASFLKSGDYDGLAQYYQEQLKQKPDALDIQTRLSRIMITAGRLSDAQELLQSAVERAPDDIDARLTLIDVLVAQGKIADVVKQFEQLEKIDPGNPDHLIRWGQVVLDGSETEIQERREAAATVWMRLAENQSDNAVLLSQVADQMRSIERNDDAIKLYRQAIEKDPTSPQYREYLGEFLFTLDRKDEAIEVWKSIAEGDRHDRDSLVRLAEVFGTFKQADLALQAWTDASKFDLTFPQELRYASKLTDAKRYDEALTRLDHASTMAEAPDEQEQLLKEQIAVYQASGTLQAQIARLAKQPESVDSLRRLALMQAADGDLVAAEGAIQKAMKREPDNTDVLLVAAELAERQNRFADAATWFGRLADVETRYRTNYLQRVAGLQIRLGQADKAMQTCQQIIDANPASTESYQFFARTAFGIGRDEEGIAALRRGLTVAPRDNMPRRMLASHFADRFRTDEAIELYWQAYRYETKTDDKIGVIRALAPLYDRKTDLDSLLGRIEELNRKEDDPRTTSLMIAAAQETVQDFGAARKTLEPLLADAPRDLQLLENMVRLSDVADEIESAADFQKRIVDLAGTPENRFKLIQLQLEAGTIDIGQALSQRISFLADPSALGNMIRSAAMRGDSKTAQKICLEAIRKDDSLWDIKLTLAQLLLVDKNSEETEANHKQARVLLTQVREADIPIETLPPTRKIIAKKPTSPSARATSVRTSPQYWSQSNYQLIRMLGIGQNQSYGYSYQQPGIATVSPSNFGHARAIATTLDLLADTIGKTPAEAVKVLDARIEKEFDFKPPEEVNEPSELWTRMAIAGLPGYIDRSLQAVSPTGGLSKRAQEQRDLSMRIFWRLAELDPDNSVMSLISMLSQRLQADSMPASANINTDPLNEKQLQQLTEIYKDIQNGQYVKMLRSGGFTGQAKMQMQAILANEYRLADRMEDAEKLADFAVAEDMPFEDLSAAIGFYLRLEKTEQAELLLKNLLSAAREGSAPAPSQGIQAVIGDNNPSKEFYEKHRFTFLDAKIARWSLAKSNAPPKSSSLGNGTVRTYYRTATNSYRSIAIKGPLSSRLLDSALAQTALSHSDLSQVASNSFTQSSGSIEVPSDILEHLEKPLEGALPEEQKSRLVLAAYCHWWAKRPDECYRILVDLCTKQPSDIDLQIERARLASELHQPRLALQALDSFDPLDSKMLVRKEMAAMNLAAELGDSARAKVAAERLFGMRLDVQTQLALADQLKRLGLNEQSEAMLSRTRTGRRQDINVEIQIAQAFLSAGKPDTAGEVAYGLMRRLSTGRAPSNAQYYQQQVVSILQQAGRLEPLIERAKRRCESSPKSVRLKQELAELYTAAGRSEDASKVWDSISTDGKANAQQLMARAEILGKAKKYEEAVMLYLDAFEKEPQRFSNDYYKMSNLARRGGSNVAEKMYERLMNFPLESIPSYRMSELFSMSGSRDWSDAKMKLLRKVLKSPYGQTEIYNITRNLTADQKSKVPEYREAMLSAICAPEAFTAQANIWTVRSRSSGGTARGPLEDMMSLITKDEAAAEKFLAAVQKHQGEEDKKPTADFLLALIDVMKDQEVEQAAKTIQGVLQQRGDQYPTSAVISGGLLWQAGQILETKNSFPIDTIVDVYEEAKRTNTSTSSNPQYTIDARLLDIYVKAGQPDQAREMLIGMLDGQDFSRINSSNPGYGDYQTIQSHEWIAKKLIECDAPLDAWVVYRKTLSDPDTFERAKRWGGSRDYKTNFETGVKTAAGKVNADLAIKFLQRNFELWETDFDNQPIQFSDLPLTGVLDSNQPNSVLELALSKANGKQETREQLETLLPRAVELANTHADAWQPSAFELMLASTLQSEVSSKSMDDLFERLPKPESFEPAEGEAANPLRHKPLVGLYPLAALASRSKRPDAKELGTRLVSYLSAVSNATNDSDLTLLLASVGGDSSQSLEKILAGVESQSKPGKMPSETMVTRCLAIASNAADAGQIEFAARALTAALGNGPPLKKIVSSSDPFALSAPRRNLNPTQNGPSHMDELAATVQKLTSKLQKQLSVELQLDAKTTTTATPKVLSRVGGVLSRIFQAAEDSQKAFSNRVETPDAQALARAKTVLDAYRSIVMPKYRSEAVFTYPSPVISGNTRALVQNNSVEISSASLAMAKLAAHCGLSDEVYEELAKRTESGADKIEVYTAMIQIANESDDLERLSEALAGFGKAIGNRLPSLDAARIAPVQSQTITSQTLSASNAKMQVINQSMQAVWPVVRSRLSVAGDVELDVQSKQVFQQTAQLLTRLDLLIHSDSYTQSRQRGLSQMFAKYMVSAALRSGDENAIRDHIQKEIKQISSRVLSDADGTKRYQWSQKSSLILDWINRDLFEHLDLVVREMVNDRGAGLRDYSDRFEPIVCLVASKLDDDDRWKWLNNITFGSDGQQSLAYLAGRVKYETPPDVLRYKTPWLADVESLCQPLGDYTVANSLVMLIDEAVRQGKTAELNQRLTTLSEDPADEASIAIALLKIAEAKADPSLKEQTKKDLKGVLVAVMAKVAKNKPSENAANLVFPELEMQLAVRAAALGMEKKLYEPILRDIKSYAIRGRRNGLTSTIGYTMAKLGVGRASGATTQSPLDHFVITSIPERYRCDSDTSPTTFAINPEGFISGTSGPGHGQLMFKYPLTGSFAFSAEIKDGGWGEADVAYGGIGYQMTGWQKQAIVLGLGSRGQVKFTAPSINQGKWNTESVSVTPMGVSAACNDKEVVTDITTGSYPFVSVIHHLERTTQFRQLQLTGEPTIPREVNLIDPTMRGWACLKASPRVGKMLLPIGPDQDATQIEEFREKEEASLANGPLANQWSVQNEQLHFHSDRSGSSADRAAHLEYLRPLLDGETIAFEFWWEKDAYRFHPTIGRTTINLKEQGMRYEWITATDDLAEYMPERVRSELPEPELIATDNVPKEKAWNKLSVKRTGDQLEVILNGKPLDRFTASEQARPGIYRYPGTDIKVRAIRLTGDWPEEVPEKWLAK